jgi:hypothetical protein
LPLKFSIFKFATLLLFFQAFLTKITLKFTKQHKNLPEEQTNISKHKNSPKNLAKLLKISPPFILQQISLALFTKTINKFKLKMYGFFPIQLSSQKKGKKAENKRVFDYKSQKAQVRLVANGDKEAGKFAVNFYAKF